MRSRPLSCPSALPDVAFAVINGNYALQGGLNAGSDALAIEAADV